MLLTSDLTGQGNKRSHRLVNCRVNSGWPGDTTFIYCRGTQGLERLCDLPKVPEWSCSILRFRALGKKKKKIVAATRRILMLAACSMEPGSFVAWVCVLVITLLFRIPFLVSFSSSHPRVLLQVLFSASALGLETVSGCTWNPCGKSNCNIKHKILFIFMHY